jgi:serine protease Do
VVDQGLKVQNRVGIPGRVLGSGFFVDPSGYILTNYHVVSSEVDPEYEGYSRLFVTRSDKPGERIPAKVVGYDKILDLALLKAEIEGEYVYYPGLDVDLHPGDQVLAIGSPVSLESTVNSGIVSAVSRRFLQLGDVLQIDVPVNPGNSGGPLLDAERRVVGVVFAGLEQFQGLNFAIPTRWIGKVFPRLFEGGQIGYAWLGASVTETEKGLEVVYAVPGGPAERVGILEGDVLERIDGREVRTLADVQGYLMTFRPPVLAKVEWRSGEARKSALVALDDRPEDPLATALKRMRATVCSFRSSA